MMHNAYARESFTYKNNYKQTIVGKPVEELSIPLNEITLTDAGVNPKILHWEGTM